MQKFIYGILFVGLCILPVSGLKEKSSSQSESGRAGGSQAQKAECFIKNLVDESLGIVNGEGDSDGKRQRLSECVNKYLDIDRITKAVFSPLGYNKLSDSDKQKIRDYLKKYLITFYAGEGKLSAMMNAKLSGKLVAEPREKDFAVTTEFTKDSSPSLKIVWVTDGQKVYYVELEGINQITTLRSEMKGNVGSGNLMDYINSKEPSNPQEAS